ncbi:MAG: hypothetical protein RBR47_12405 [Bacteroidales bacterium]|jgi:hypothetical protein|nr:hypothetical protein [Bacteroidales bacterium]
MKKLEKYNMISRILVPIICLLLVSLPLIAQVTHVQQYRFCNKEGHSKGDKAKDLHITFDKAARFVKPGSGDDITTQSPAKTFPIGNGDSSNVINLGTGFTGGGVDSAECVVLTLGYHGEPNSAPNVTDWKWTRDGDPTHGNAAGNNYGSEHNGGVGKLDFAYVPSTGDGSILVSVADASYIFEMPPNVPGNEMALLFAQFITDEVAWAEVSHIAAGDVMIFPTAFGSDDDFSVEIIPDSTQEVTFKYLPETIPTLSEWGVIILLLLVVAVGMVFLYQRQSAPVLAGATASFSLGTKPRLFDRKLFAKVFAITLLIGFAGLLGAYLWFGKITSADPFGVFVSAAVVAYMVQLGMLKKEGRG